MHRRSLARLLAAPAAALILAAAPFAAGAHGVDVSQLTHGPNGGMLSTSGETYVELEPVPGRITVWLTTHEGTPVDTAAMTGTVVLQHGDDRQDLTLAPMGDHMLEIRDDAIAPAAGDRITFQSVLPDGEPVEARFEVKAPH